MLTVITKQLADNKWKKKGSIINPINIEKMIQLLLKNKQRTDNIRIYDKTYNQELCENTIVAVNDHINKTGINPLIGKQKELNIDFVDMTHVYNKHKNGIITCCFGKKLDKETDYPSHYMSLITITARAIGYKTINGFLVNKI